MLTLQTGSMRGKLQVPSSKSAALRALLLASVAPGESCIERLTLCDDVCALLSNFAALGVGYEQRGRTAKILGAQWRAVPQLHCGESAFLARTLPFFAAFQGIRTNVFGDGTLTRRTQRTLFRTLRAAGVPISQLPATLPFAMTPTKPPSSFWPIRADTSQPFSGLLMALPLSRRRARIGLFGLVSGGYLELTRAMMAQFGVETYAVPNVGLIIDAPDGYKNAQISLEGDWSAAALLLAGAAPSGSVTLHGLLPESVQPDRAILNALTLCGLKPHWSHGALTLSNPTGELLRPFTFDATHAPDLFPPLVVLASACAGRSRIVGLYRLVNKESDRGRELLRLLSSLSIEAYVAGDALVITGGTPRPRATLNSAGDHRIAMAAALIALRAEKPALLSGGECVSKSYPAFFEDLATLLAN